MAPETTHIRDAATFQLVIGIAAWLALARRNWRAPVLAILGLQFAFHSVNHLVDIGEASPHWIGVVDFALLAATAVMLARAWRATSRRSLRHD